MTSTWLPATCVATRDETATAKTIRLKVDELKTVLPGQHIDIRLTAEDGYQATRSYSLSATPLAGPNGQPLAADEVEITVEELPDGEVSPYLVEDLAPGDVLEVRGPVGGWFVWHEADPAPVQLIGGGSGVAPLAAILRARAAARSIVPMRLLNTVRGPDDLYFGDELRRFGAVPGISVDFAYTRVAPREGPRLPGRLSADDIKTMVHPAGTGITYICGPNSFVASVIKLLLEGGHDAASIRTERFGGA